MKTSQKLNLTFQDIDKRDNKFTYELYMMRDEREMPDPLIITEKENLKFISKYCFENKNHPYSVWNIIMINNRNAGTILMKHQNNELGIWLLPEYQNNGIGSIAMKKFMKENPRKYYTALVHTYNKKSQKVFEKMNMQVESVQYRISIPQYCTNVPMNEQLISAT